MKKHQGIDYSFRPENYWLHSGVLQSILRDVKGTQRRRMIKHYYENGLFQELDETITKTSLSTEERERFAKIHPTFLGGEYLRDYGKNETEIARIELKSTLADVISIRAIIEDEIITYSVVDEPARFPLGEEGGLPFALAVDAMLSQIQNKRPQGFSAESSDCLV